MTVCLGMTSQKMLEYRWGALALLFLLSTAPRLSARSESNNDHQSARKISSLPGACQDQRMPEAISAELEAISRKPSAAGFSSLGKLYFQQNLLNCAEAAFQAALEINPVSSADAFALAQILDKEGRYSAEVHCLQQIPLAGLPESAAFQLQLTEAAALAEDNQFAAAESLLKKLAAGRADSVEVLMGLASLYGHHERYDDSAAEYRRVLELDPSNRIAVLSLAKVLLMGNHLREALPYLRDYVQRSPSEPEAHDILGEVFKRLGQFRTARTEFQQSIDLNPSNYKAWYGLGFVLANLGSDREAIAALETAKKLNPDAPEVRYELGRLQATEKSSAGNPDFQAFERLKQQDQVKTEVRKFNDVALQSLGEHDWQAAARACGAALRLNPNEPVMHYNLSLALAHLGDPAAEEKELEEAIRLDPKFAKARNRLGLRYMALGRWADAEREFGAAINADPQFAEAKNNLGVLYGREGKNEEAIEVFRKVTLDDPQNAQAFLNWGLVLDGARQYAQAEAMINRAILLSPSNVDAYLALGMTEAELGRLDQAVAAYQKAEALEPGRFDIHLDLGLALARQDHFQEAKDKIQDALKVSPNDIDALTALGMIEGKMGHHAESVQSLRRVMSLSPESPGAHFNLGIALADQHDLEGAVNEFSEAIRLNPNSAAAYYNKGRVLYDLNRRREALPFLDAACQLDPNYPQALYLLAVVLGASPRAEEVLVKLVAVDPTNPEAHSLLADALERSGNSPAAIAQWKISVSLDPQNSSSLYNLARLLTKLNDPEAKEYMDRFEELQRTRQSSDKIQTLNNFALEAANAHNWPQAIEELQESIKACGQCKQLSTLHRNLGLIHAREGDLKDAQRELEIALEIDPKDSDAQKAMQMLRSVSQQSDSTAN